MIYVFDTCPVIDLFKHYYPDQFPTLWNNFNQMIEDERIISTREVLREIGDQDDEVSEWGRNNTNLFTTPTAEETSFVTRIYQVEHFQQNINKQKLLNGGKNADPFVIAKAAVIEGGCVVTAEKVTPNAAKIPNICEHFDVRCLNLRGFMNEEGWVF